MISLRRPDGQLVLERVVHGVIVDTWTPKSDSHERTLDDLSFATIGPDDANATLHDPGPEAAPRGDSAELTSPGLGAEATQVAPPTNYATLDEHPTERPGLPPDVTDTMEMAAPTMDPTTELPAPASETLKDGPSELVAVRDAAVLERHGDYSEILSVRPEEKLHWKASRVPMPTHHRRVGDYLIVGALGRTPDAELLVGHRPDAPGQLRVIKRAVQGDPSQWENLQARMLEDAKANLKLEHPNIIKVVDFGEDDGVPFMSRELIDGVSLRGLRALHGGALPLSVVVDIARQVGEALSYAHGQLAPSGRNWGLTHGQLGPSAILISRDGVARITEVGVSRLHGQHLRPRSGGRRGCTGYAAPEQQMGGAVDARTDVFTLGLVIAELLGGDALVEQNRPDLSDPTFFVERCCANRPELPEALQPLLLRMTAADREDRPASAASILGAFDRIAGLVDGPRLQDLAAEVFERAAPLTHQAQPLPSRPPLRLVTAQIDNDATMPPDDNPSDPVEIKAPPKLTIIKPDALVSSSGARLFAMAFIAAMLAVIAVALISATR